jgi:uncharacterized protein (TIGR02186 family)
MKLKALLIITLVMTGAQAIARPMITDLSERKIDIDAQFTGKELLLYGARVEAGNIVVVIRGPEADFVVRQKEKVAGMWVNTQKIKFYDVTQFYRIASSAPLKEIEASQIIAANEIGKNSLRFQGKSNSSNLEKKLFEDAIVQKLMSEKLLNFDVIELPFLEGTLFRTQIDFPEKIADGTYTAEIYSFNDGQLQGMQSIPITVNKVGAEAFLYNSAHNYPLIYGLAAVVLAILMGMGAGRLFKKV